MYELFWASIKIISNIELHYNQMCNSAGANSFAIYWRHPKVLEKENTTTFAALVIISQIWNR